MNFKLVGLGVVLLAGAAAATHWHVGETTTRVYLPNTALTQLIQTTSAESDSAPQPASGMRLQIPSINLDAPVDQLGPDAQGHLTAPTKWDDTGWYRDGPRPGQDGVALIMGHVDSNVGPAVFWNLHKVPVGASVVVNDNGRQLEFRVTDSRSFPETQPPLGDIFSTDPPSRLALLTCSGDFNPLTHRYNDRLMVTAQLA
jgi:LPXTG-site transpeptidase (sortase) family protein